jgi:hypothetical protein
MVNLKCETDEDFVQNATIFLSHIATCPSCHAVAESGEGLECVEAIFDTLSRMSGLQLAPPYYNDAVAFCRQWMLINGVEPKADQIILHKSSTKH